jgi:subtilisin family serine protease
VVAAGTLFGLAVVEPLNALAASSDVYLVVVSGDKAVGIVANHFESQGVEVVAELTRAVDMVSAVLTPEQLADIRQRPGVRSVEPDELITTETVQTISSSRSDDNWGLDRIDQKTGTLDGRFHYLDTAGGAGVDVYVVDTGLRTTHSEFVGRVGTGYFVPSVTDPETGQAYNLTSPEDDCGHGTHVAGIAAGTKYGVAKRATVIPIKIFPGGSAAICDRGTSVTAFTQGIDWILANRSRTRPAVANLSLGLSSDSTPLNTAIQNLAAVMPVVVAAGNDGDLATTAGYVSAGTDSTRITRKSPACTADKLGISGVLTVAATGGLAGDDSAPTFDGFDKEARYSNHGPCVDIFAPGTDIKSAWPVADNVEQRNPDVFPNNYSDSGTFKRSGTSMASPFVAGAAAILLQQFPTETPGGLTARILANATRDVVTLASRVGGGAASPNLLLYICGLDCMPSTPTAPKNVVLTRGVRNEINVLWEAPDSDGGAAITGYTATATPTAGTAVTCASAVPTLSCKLTGLVAGTSYSVTVTATNATGTGTTSTAKSLTPGAAPASPGTPTGVAGNSEVRVTWTAPADDGGLAITKYTVTSTPEGKTCSPAGTELVCTVTSLSPGTVYTFAVTATNEAGSATSLASAAVIPVLPWEYVPAFVAVTPANRRVDLEWSEARVLGAAPAGYFTGYEVKDATGAVVCVTTALKCSVGQLTNASKASFTVAATTLGDKSQVAASPEVLVGGLRQLGNVMPRKASALLSKIATTNSKGKVTWRALSGGCRIVGKVLTAPSKGKSCRLRVSVAKWKAFPAQTLVLSIELR